MATDPGSLARYRASHNKSGAAHVRVAELITERTLLIAELDKAHRSSANLHEYLSKRLQAEEVDRQSAIAAAVEEEAVGHLQAAAGFGSAAARREEEMQATIFALRAEVRLREEDLVELRAFRDERERFEAILADSRSALEDERRARRDDVARLEREHLCATDTIRKEMLRRVQAAKSNFGAIAGEVLERTMHTTVLEHHLMGRELIEQAQSTDSTIAENLKLRARNAELRRSNELLEQQVQEHARRSRTAQRLLERSLEQRLELQAREAASMSEATDELTRRAVDAERALHGLVLSADGASLASALGAPIAPSSVTTIELSDTYYRQRPGTARAPSTAPHFASNPGRQLHRELTPYDGRSHAALSTSTTAGGSASLRSRVPTIAAFDINNLLSPRPPPVGANAPKPPPPPSGPSVINRPLSAAPRRHRPMSAR
jgi:hypothetical protein